MNFWKKKEKYRVMTYTDFETRRIITEVVVSNPLTGLTMKCRGLWDTGGRVSTISQSVIESIGLMPDKKMSYRVQTTTGVHFSAVYPIVLMFDDVGLGCSAMSCEKIIDEVDIIIGMDIITKGDFSITNANGRTEMIFRLPTSGHIGK